MIAQDYSSKKGTYCAAHSMKVRKPSKRNIQTQLMMKQYIWCMYLVELLFLTWTFVRFKLSFRFAQVCFFETWLSLEYYVFPSILGEFGTFGKKWFKALQETREWPLHNLKESYNVSIIGSYNIFLEDRIYDKGSNLPVLNAIISLYQ